METKANIMCKKFMDEFKKKIFEEIETTGVLNDPNYNKKFNEIINKINNHPHLVIKKNDFKQIKRIIREVPNEDRCTGLKATNEQCTRKKKNGCKFCGTHEKGRPFGEIENNSTSTVHSKVFVDMHEINGISYYIDTIGNIYDPEDVTKNVNNPKKIGVCKKNNETNTFYEIKIFE